MVHSARRRSWQRNLDHADLDGGGVVFMRSGASQAAPQPAGCPDQSILSDWEHRPVILLCPDPAQTTELRARLMALGTEVYAGACGLEVEEDPLILVSAQGRRDPDIIHRLDHALQMFPMANVCFVTGTTSRPSASAKSVQSFDMVSALLNTAGICFVSGLDTFSFVA
jgi:hypothetical protein